MSPTYSKVTAAKKAARRKAFAECAEMLKARAEKLREEGSWLVARSALSAEMRDAVLCERARELEETAKKVRQRGGVK